MESEPVEHGWELSKENVAPLARGRDKASLQVALHATAADIAEARAHHEAAVRNAAAGRGPHAADPLAPAYSFIKWATDAYQPRSPQLIAALEAVCMSFIDKERYHNDRRYVHLWIQYADARPDPLDCLTFMRSKGVGLKATLFYEAWATTLEFKHDFQASDRVYGLGLENNAQPRDRLEQRRREFLARMVARDRRREKAESAQREESGGLNATRTNNDENARPALGSISGRSGLTVRTHGSMRRGPLPAAGESSLSKPRLQSAPPNSELRVFSDPPNKSPSVLNSNTKMNTLAKFDEVVKENDGRLPTKWAGNTLPQNPNARAKLRAQKRKWSFYKDGLALSAMEQERENDRDAGMTPGPLGDSCTTDPPMSPGNDGTGRSREEQKLGNSPTINTKIAMQEVEDMFNSPLPFEYRPLTDSAGAPSADRSVPSTPIPAQAFVPSSSPSSDAAESISASKNRANGGKSRMTDWCLELIPDLPGFVIVDNDVCQLTENSLLMLQSGGDSWSYLVETKLGEGYENNSSVFSAAAVDMTDDADDDEESNSVAIKVASTINLAWEFYIYNALRRRLSGDGLRRVPRATAFYNGSPVSYLVLDRVSNATLAQVLELELTRATAQGNRRPGAGPISERVAMFFVVELLKALETVHEAGIIHADVTLENIVLRNDQGPWDGPYNAAGEGGWVNKGIAVIDFNHAIDTRHSAVGEWTAEAIVAHTAFLGNAHVDSSYVVASRQGAEWSFNADCHAASVCARRLLFVEDSGTNSMKELEYGSLWQELLAQLASVGPEALSNETIGLMRDWRCKLEDILIKEPVKETPLRVQLKSLFIAASEARLANDTTQG